jgi:acyl-CoA thioester hydrolase
VKTARVAFDVPFHDTDAMAVVWHGNHVKYFELAREALFRRMGFGPKAMTASGHLWPVIELHCRYAAPLRYAQRVAVKATLQDVEHRVKVLYEILDAKTRKRLAYGHTVQVAVDAKTGEMCLVTPAAFRSRAGASRG